MKKKPAIRIDGGKRTKLARHGRRDAAAEPKPPIEDDRASAAWARQERRDVAAKKLRQEKADMQREASRPRQTVSTKKVENPYWEPAKEGEKGVPRLIEAPVNLRESAIETLVARGGLNRAQQAAADEFRRFWEVRWSGAEAMDYSRDRVDAGSSPSPISESQINARRELDKAEALLGRPNYVLTSRVCGEGKALSEIFLAKRDRLTAADNLRNSLSDLAGMWRFQTETQDMRLAREALDAEQAAKNARQAARKSA